MNRLRLAAVLCATVLLTACQTEPEGSNFILGPGAAESDPSNITKAQAACEARGGEWREAGHAGLLACFTTPRDAGKTCERSTDCETECLARSHSCAPIKPLIGCNDVLDSSGRMVTLCLD
ncbi:hypothetical protein [Celeribacter sp.]|uniref:hypothetical protein n=1 Tax=Celeribacter sp. TaxID=1890673 RepID=UPI003A8EA66D